MGEKELAKAAPVVTKRSLATTMAAKFEMEPRAFIDALKATVLKQGQGKPPVTDEEVAAFLAVAHEYKLNPFTKEIYGFPSRGGIVPIVPIDGWSNIVNSHPQYDGCKFHDELDEKGNLVFVTCELFRKDRTHTTPITEYMAECKRDTEPWTKWPRRMLRHKAFIQSARMTFSLSGIHDPDEGERIRDALDAEVVKTDLSDVPKLEVKPKPAEASGFLVPEPAQDLPPEAPEPEAAQPAAPEPQNKTFDKKDDLTQAQEPAAPDEPAAASEGTAQAEFFAEPDAPKKWDASQRGKIFGKAGKLHIRSDVLWEQVQEEFAFTKPLTSEQAEQVIAWLDGYGAGDE